MIKRDLIKDQIEQLGKMIGMLIAKFLDLKTLGDIEEAIQITNKELLAKVNLDLDQLVNLTPQEVEASINSTNLTDKYLDQLANYLFEVGLHKKTSEKGENSLQWFKLAQQFLDLADKKTDMITFERMGLRSKIEKEL